MKNKINLIVISLFLFVIVLGCDGFSGVQGKVTDVDGKPLKGAKVTLKIGSDDYETETKPDGSYLVYETHAPLQMTYKLIVTKEGFQTYEQDFKSQAELGKIRDIILIKQ